MDVVEKVSSRKLGEMKKQTQTITKCNTTYIVCECLTSTLPSKCDLIVSEYKIVCAKLIRCRPIFKYAAVLTIFITTSDFVKLDL
jgi:hypothetical protein